MSVTQQQVLDALAKVASPRGVALTNANVLSAITAATPGISACLDIGDAGLCGGLCADTGCTPCAWRR